MFDILLFSTRKIIYSGNLFMIGVLYVLKANICYIVLGNTIYTILINFLRSLKTFNKYFWIRKVYE